MHFRLFVLALGFCGVCPGKKLVSCNFISPYPLIAFLVSLFKSVLSLIAVLGTNALVKRYNRENAIL